jgi:RHS repeat-associated protein
LSRETTFAYANGRYSSSIKADGSTWQVAPSQVKGLSGLVKLDDLYARATDGRTKATKVWHDDFGNATQRVDALGNTFLSERNAKGLVTRVTTPDPDGVGPLPQLVTTYSYDTRGHLTLLTAPDGSVQTWEYDPTFSQVTRYVDQLGRETVYTVDASTGNVTQVTRRGVAGSAADVALGDPSRAWQNPWNRLDVNGDGYVSAVDVLTVINALSATGSRPLLPPTPGSTPPPYLDVNGDDYLSSADVLSWNNSLNGTATLTTLYVYTNGTNVPNVPRGLLYEVIDPLGHKTRFEYGTVVNTADFARLTKVTYAVGTPVAVDVEYGYDVAGNVIWSADELDRRTDYAYDRRDRLTQVLSPDPDWISATQPGPLPRPVLRQTYDRLANLVTTTDTYEGESTTGVLRTTGYSYDKLNRLKQVTLPIPVGANSADAPVTIYGYDPNGNLTSVTDARLNTTNYEYDDLNRLWRETRPSPDGLQARPTTVYAYDPLGDLTQITDAKGRATKFTYDRRQRVLEEKRPHPTTAVPSVTTAYAYDAAGQLLSVTDPLGRTTTYGYDAFGRLVREQGPAPTAGAAAPVVNYAYDGAGNLRGTVDARRNFSELRYDERDRLIVQLGADPDGPGGPLTAPGASFFYDAASQLQWAVDPLSRTTGYQYDRLGRTTVVTLPDPDGAGSQLAAQTVSEYDAYGDLIKTKERLQQAGGGVTELLTQYAFDRLGRVVSTTDPRNAVTGFGYDKVGNRTRVTDPLNNDTLFTYDNLNRLKQEQNELGYTRTYAYDAVNNLTSRTDRNGRTVSYGYDHLDRRTSETFGSSYTATYRYDLADQLTQASDGMATYGYGYDTLGRATTVTNTLGGTGVPGPVTFTQEFDLNGNRTQLSTAIGGTMSAGADFVNQYTFDALNRLTRVAQAGQTGGHAVREKRIDFSYAADSQWTGITRYQDLAGTKLVAASAFSYDQAGRLQGLTHTQNATTLAAFTWTYDTLNRVKTFTDTLHPAESATYAYDTASQLTGADRSGTGNDETFSYDANGNRTNYTTVSDNRLQSDGTYTYLYDNEGNRTRRTKIVGGSYTEYVWDHRNRLTSVTDKTASGAITRQVFYTYDVFDRRVAKQVDWDGAGAQVASKEYYVYDGQHIALKFVDPDASGSQPSALRSRLLHGPVVDQILADEVLTSMSVAGNVLWPLTDNLGTVRDIVDFNETTNVSQIANHLAYDAFGRITSETNAAVDSLFGFTGRERDEESWYWDAALNRYTGGHYHYRGRVYDPTVGRFLSQDPIGFEAGDPNLYRYVGNGPTYAIDPSGAVLVAVDGTGSKEFREKGKGFDKRTGRYRSHTRNFYEDYAEKPDERKAYWDGPCNETTGSDAAAIHQSVMDFLEPILKANPDETVNLVGHSRGGYIVMEVARTLKQRGYKVNFLGMYDAVDMAPGFGEAETIPSNVGHSAHAVGDWATRSRPYFNTADHGPEDVSNMKSCHVKPFMATHGGIGGAPWSGDRPRGMQKSIDERESRAVDEWMRRLATEAGILFRGP